MFNYNRLGVSAKKSWFFSGDVMIALGTAINAPTATNPVLTTLNQSLLKSDVIYRTGAATTTLTGTASPSALEWVHHDGTGYFFPDTVSNASISGVDQTGSWQSVNTGQSAAPVTLGVFSLHLNHGTAVSGGTYAYIVAPGIDAGAMDAFAASDYQILRNDETVQAVKDTTSNKTFANFLAPGTVGGLTSDSKASVLLKQDENFIDLAISDPTQANTGHIVLELASPVAGLIHADTGITWNNRPHPAASAASTWLPVLSTRTRSDVLSAVLTRSGGPLDFNVTTMAPTFDGFVHYASRENPDPTLHPTLELVLPRSEMEIWRIERFGTQTGNPTVSGHDADPDADGETNFYEFATGQNPLAASRITPAMVRSAAGMEFSYTRSKAAVAEGVAFIVEWSDTLAEGSWSTLTSEEIRVSETRLTETCKELVPSGDTGSVFVRLRVVR